MESKLLQLLVLRHDLEIALNEIRHREFDSIIHVKAALLSLHHVADFDRSVKSLYEKNESLSTCLDGVRKELAFFSYLRNKFVGHLTDDLFAKTLEWKPEIILSMQNDDWRTNLSIAYNIFILETAINTYVDERGRHKIYDTETDLRYPADVDRFFASLINSMDRSLEFLQRLEEVLRPLVHASIPFEEQIELWRQAGETEFSYLSKRKR